jgi:transposase
VSHTIRADYSQRWLLPPSLEDWLPPQHPARFVRDLVDSLDLHLLGFREPAPGEDGRPHYANEMLLSIWLYGWMERVRSSRALEKACLRDVAFMWLTGNNHPDHNTLWRFFRDNRPALRKLFKRVVQVAAEAGLVGFALHALDGTKIRAASSMETALHRKALQEALKKLDQAVETAMASTEAAEQQEDASYAMPADMQNPSERKRSIQEALARLDAAETNHMHPLEPEARVMKMRSSGPTLAFNAQAVVDHDSDLILVANVGDDQTDHTQLVPSVHEVLETLGEVAEQTVADAGYASGEQFEEAERRRLPVLVNVQEESSTKGEFAKSRFSYDPDHDAYVCPLGEELPFERIEPPSKDKPAPRRVYRCHNLECPVRAQCTSDKRGRTIKRLPTEDAFVRQVKRQSTPAMQRLMGLRKEIVEHIFGIAKTIDGFARFTSRGLENARTQWALVCTAINLRKLLPAWRDGRLFPTQA